MQHREHPYQLPSEPSSIWELLRWVYHEPLLLDAYSESLSKRETWQKFLLLYGITSMLIVLVFLSFHALLAFFDIPNAYPSLFKPSMIVSWLELRTLQEKYFFLLGYHWGRLAFGLAGGLAGGLAFGLAFGLAVGLAVGLAGGLAVGLAFGLAGGLAFGLAVGLAFGLAGGLAVGLGTMIGWYIGYYRLADYNFRLVFNTFSNSTFYNNSYTKSAVNWIPIYSLERQLLRQASQQPEEALQFINFLLTYRPLQRAFAMKLRHVVLATQWASSPICLLRFKSRAVFDIPEFIEEEDKLYPNLKWQEQAKLLGKQLSAASKESNSLSQAQLYEKVKEIVEHFHAIHLTQSPSWTKYYKGVFKRWKKQVEQEILRLKKLNKGKINNPYIVGNQLHPEKNDDVFVGREKEKELFKHEVRNPKQLPLFLIYGQRRVGKSSLLNFLSQILDHGFVVIRQDCQAGAIIDLQSWLKELHDEVNSVFNLKETWQAPQNGIKAWDKLSQYILQQARRQDKKIVLAFDEYENIHKKVISENKEQGELLLGAMRSFSQRQSEVIFLFVGAKLFSALESPRWSDFFPHSKEIYLDYLEKEDAHLLLTHPYEDFPIKYEEGVLEEVFRQTQGHPSLLQVLGDAFVGYCEIENTYLITQNILTEIIRKAILTPGQGVFTNFWEEFCEKQARKDTIIQIIEQEQPTDKESLRHLLLYQYIIKKDGRFQMRIPLLEQWIREQKIDDLKF